MDLTFAPVTIQSINSLNVHVVDDVIEDMSMYSDEINAEYGWHSDSVFLASEKVTQSPFLIAMEAERMAVTGDFSILRCAGRILDAMEMEKAA